MAEVKVRTPEDLDKVFTDIFNLLYKMQYEISNIESELHKLNTPTITTTPYIILPRLGLGGGGDYEETKDNS